jgi:hypothetical protein
MSRDDLSRLLRWYPQGWRARYGDELITYMEDNYGDRRPPMRDRLSVVAGGLRERVQQAGLSGESVPPEERMRAAVLLILVAWAGFVLAGLSFAKLSEHFDDALPGGVDNPVPPGGTHHVPDLAYRLLQTVATGAGIVAIIAAALALPALVRYLRRGGWVSLRAHVVRAIAVSALALAVAVPLLIWAHHLTVHQRNGGMPQYSALFLGWAVLVAMSITLWTGAGIAAARRISISRRLLLTEAGLALALTVAMSAMLATTAVWWASMASTAPAFLGKSPASAPINPTLAITVTVMVLADAIATSGTVRIVRTWLVRRHA